MASKTVQDWVSARLATWPNLAACPLAEINHVEVSPAPAFVEIEYPVSIEERISVGKPGLFREEGGIRFIIRVAALDKAAYATALTWVEELRDLFRDQESGALRTYEASPAILDDRGRESTRYAMPFVVRYTYDYVR